MATVLYFVPHQDDELLSFANDIIEHVQAGEDVKVCICMDGAGSYVRRSLREGGTCSSHSGTHEYGLTFAEFSKARDLEFVQSLNALGVATSNILYYPTRWRDNSLTVARAKEFMLYYLNKYPKAKVKTFTPHGASSMHVDHKALGQAAMELYKAGKIYNNDLRLFVETYEIDNFRKLNPNINAWQINCLNTTKLNNAIAAYKVWNPGTVPNPGKVGTVQKVASNDVLNVRSGPGTKYSVVFTLSPDKGSTGTKNECEIIGSSGSWLQVKNVETGKTGYCNSAYIKRYKGASATSRFACGYHSVKGYIDDFANKKLNYVHKPQA